MQEGRAECERAGERARGQGRVQEGRMKCERAGQSARGQGRVQEGPGCDGLSYVTMSYRNAVVMLSWKVDI